MTNITLDRKSISGSIILKRKRVNNVIALSIVAVCFFLLLSQPASAATYYVSPSGNDANNGLSTGAAWKSPSYAASRAVAGDTIYLMNGVWYNQHVVFNKKGTSTAPITMKAYSGTPVLDGVDKTGLGIRIYSSSWINIEGIKVQNYEYGYSVTSSNNLKITDCEFSNTGMDGITLWNDIDYMTIDSVIVTNTGDHGIHIWNQNSPTRSQYITVKNCAISNAPHNLLDIHTNVTDVVVDNNELFYTTDYRGAKQVGLYLHNGNTDNIVIRNNVFRDQARPLEIFNSNDLQVTGNTFRNINGRAIFLAGIKGYDNELGVFDSTFKGNTFDNVNYAFGLWAADSRFRNLDLVDNNYVKVLNNDYLTADQYYAALSGKYGFPQILLSTDRYYTVRDVVSSPYTTATSTDKLPVANAGADVTISAGSTVTLNGGASSDDKGISSYSWDFDASNGIQSEATGKTVSRAFNTAGKFTVTLTVTDTAGQKSTDTCIVTVNAPAVSFPDVSAPDEIPIANAGSDITITAGSTATLNGGASSDDKGISSYSWDFDASNGIQNDANGMIASRVFNTAGKFTVTLTVTDTAGKKSTDTCTVTVNAPVVSDAKPAANAGADITIIAGSTVTLNGGASSDDKGISSYSWDLDASNGIQNDAVGMSVSRAFNTAGKFTVTLTVTDTAGQKSTDTCIVTVNAPVVYTSDKLPIANAGYDRVSTVGQRVYFSASRSTDDKGIKSYSWDFDASNGIQSDASGMYVSYVFTTAKIHTVTLTVTDTAGQKSSGTVTVTVSGPTVPVTDTVPLANAGSDVTITAGSTVTLNGGASSDDKGISSYSWDFDASNGIQSEATGMSVSRAFNTAGKFTVVLTVTDTAGQKSTDTCVVTVNAPVIVDEKPVANAGADVTITAGSAVTFNGGASSDDKGISSYSWDFDVSNGIQNDAIGMTASHVFNTAGKFTVTLTVTDTAGQKSTDTRIITVNAPVVSDAKPTANAGPDVTITAGSSVTLNGGASSDDKGISSYSWDFDASNGIQNDAVGMSVSRTFNTAGKFTVTLTVTDTAGQKSTDTCIVTVNAPVISDAKPISNAGYNRVSIVGQKVYFSANRSTDDKGIKSYSWDFDASNGIQSDASGMYISYAFTTAKTYTVTLTVTDTAGQESSDTITVKVNSR